MTLFEKITKDKETLAEYLLECCDNPVCERNEDMCDFCEKPCERDVPCTDDYCLKAVLKGLSSEVE